LKAAILLTGDEITRGIVKDTDGGYLAETLTEMGFDVRSIVIVPDSAECMLREMRSALKRVDLLVITGGLGSTFDDITLETVARFCGRDLEYDSDYHSNLEKSFEERFARPAPEELRRQARYIRGSVPLLNAVGSARGSFLKISGKEIVLLPGPPMEMKVVFEEATKHITTPLPSFTKTIGFVDLTEPEIEAFLEEQIARYPRTKFVTRVKYFSGPTVMISSRDVREVEEICSLFEKNWGANIYTTDGRELVEILVSKLIEIDKTVSIAESCTGGRLSAAFTSVPGVSRVFPGSIVSYSNKVKDSILGVRPETLKRHGAVSEEVAIEMAKGVTKLFGTIIGLSVSGIAGPGGGTETKPVGLVCSSVKIEDRVWSFTDRFRGDRETIQLRAASVVIKRFWRLLWKRDSTA
jgi:nicotinamide-nucleotide amidase